MEPSGRRAEFHLQASPLRLEQAEGSLSGNLEIAGGVPIENAAFRLDGLEARGELQIEGRGLRVPDLARAIDASATIALIANDGRVALTTRDLQARAEPLASPDGPEATILSAPWQLRTGSKERPLELVLAPASDAYRLDVDGALTLSAAKTRLEGSARASLTLDQRLDPRALGPANVVLAAQDLAWRDLEAQSARLEVSAEGPLSELQGTAQLAVAGGKGDISGLKLEGLRLEQAFDLARSGERAVLMLKQGGAVNLASLDWEGRIRTGPVMITPRASDDAFLVVQTEDGLLRGWEQMLSAGIEADDVRILDAGEPAASAQMAAEVRLSLSRAAGGLDQGLLLLSEGRIRVPDQAVNLEGIRSEVALESGGLAPDQTIPIEVARITHGGEPPWFRPLTLTASLRPPPASVDLQGTISRAGGALDLAFRGSHDAERARTRLVIDGSPIRFEAGGLQPVDLVPALGTVLGQTSGQVDLDGELVWQGDELHTDLALLLDNLDLTAGPARLAQMNGLVRFDRLRPPATPPGQQLSAARLEVGLALTQGFTTFQLEPDGPLAVQQLRFRFAGGTLRAEPFSVGSDDSAMSVILKAEGLDLARLLEQMQLPGLTGEGRINGRLPVVIEGSEALIEGGELVSERPGWLRYRPDQPPAALQSGAQGLDLLLQALENFRYEELRVTLDGRTDAEMDIQLHIKGANPGLHDGYPIEFNLNLEGELGNILRSNLSGFHIPEPIRRRLESER
jgi:Dicarboxylate transport